MRPLVRSYGVISTSTSSPVSTRMRFLRILPAVWPRISWPFSSSTRNIALGSNSTTLPRISSNSSLAKRTLSLRQKVAEAYSAPPQKGRRANSDREDRRSRGLALLKRAVGFGRVLERKALLDLDLDLALADDVEQLPGAILELLARRDVVKQCRPRQV